MNQQDLRAAITAMADIISHATIVIINGTITTAVINDINGITAITAKIGAEKKRCARALRIQLCLRSRILIAYDVIRKFIGIVRATREMFS